jgi:IS5 family transposase
MEDAVYDSQAIRRFIGIDLTVDVASDATTLLKFRRLLEMHTLSQVVFDTFNGQLAEEGLLLKKGTIVDATIIAAPSSTKNQSGERDADMHQTKQGKTWHLGMKAHIGVDADSGLVHTIVKTAANTADVSESFIIALPLRSTSLPRYSRGLSCKMLGNPLLTHGP